MHHLILPGKEYLLDGIWGREIYLTFRMEVLRMRRNILFVTPETN